MRQWKRHIRNSQEGDRLDSSGRGARGRTKFTKYDIPRDPHPMSNITLVLCTIPKENILN